MTTAIMRTAIVFSKSRIYRIAAIAGVLVALILTFSAPHKMFGPDSWAYYYAAENFSHGDLVISSSTRYQQSVEAEEQGSRIFQYVHIGEGNWAVEKPPGYIFFLVPFHMLGIPWFANLLLTLGMAAVTYLVLKRLKGEAAACIGVLLMLFTPMTLIMLNKAYMGTFSATAFLVMGAGLYLYEILPHDRAPRWWVLFLASLLMGWSVVVRYTNFLVVALFALHFGVSRGRRLFTGRHREVARQIVPLLLGMAIPAGILLAYNNSVFGSPWNHGYEYSKFGVKFAFEYIGESTAEGKSVAWEIIKGNFRSTPLALLTGFPALAIALPGVVYVAWQKGRGWLRRWRARLSGMGEYPWPEIPCPVLALLIGWFLAVFGLYFLYEWTSGPHMQDVHYMVIDRFYLPGLFPVVIITALILTRLWKKLTVILMLTFLILGSVFFVRSLDYPRAWSYLGPPPTLPRTEYPWRPPIPDWPPELTDLTRQEVRASPTTTDTTGVLLYSSY